MTFRPDPKEKKKKKVSRSSLVKKLDDEFSIFIRTRKLEEGLAECYTCGKNDEWKNMQCGHFQSRKHYATRWDEKNCQVQCVGCNVYRYGEQYKFGLHLDLEYGSNTASELMAKAKETNKIKDFELESKIDYYKKLNKNLQDQNL